jgi:hypothetical protein
LIRGILAFFKKYTAMFSVLCTMGFVQFIVCWFSGFKDKKRVYEKEKWGENRSGVWCSRRMAVENLYVVQRNKRLQRTAWQAGTEGSWARP